MRASRLCYGPFEWKLSLALRRFDLPFFGQSLGVHLLLWLAIGPCAAFAQSELGSQLAELASLTARVRDNSTNIRVDAFHRAWAIGVASRYPEVKISALNLIKEPAGSASDHIRIPAVYAIAEIANSTDSIQAKIQALNSLREPMQAAQVPIRDVAIDAVNSIVSSAKSVELDLEALKLLGEAVRSGNNAVRMPAINAIIRTVESVNNDQVCSAALALLVAPLDSISAIGGMEVRMMAVVAVERAGILAPEIGTKAKAAGMLRAYAGNGSWEPEARKRAEQGAARVQESMNKPVPAQSPADRSKV